MKTLLLSLLLSTTIITACAQPSSNSPASPAQPPAGSGFIPNQTTCTTQYSNDVVCGAGSQYRFLTCQQITIQSIVGLWFIDQNGQYVQVGVPGCGLSTR